jgi:dipeptidyl-peptidase-4
MKPVLAVSRRRIGVVAWLGVSVAILFAIPVVGDETVDPARLTLERIFDGEEFSITPFGPARWLADGSGYTTLELSADFEDTSAEGADETKPKDIVRYDPASGDRTVLLAAKSLIPEEGGEPLEIEDYHWSDDDERLLIFTNTSRVWRRNTRGDYWILDLADGKLRQLGGEMEASVMMFAKLSPDGTKVAWVDFDDKDLYVQDLASMKVTRLTDDESEYIINGTSDWVYEEEFSLRDGFRWSPDGRHIAYWQFDSEGVGTFNLINNTDTLYPELTPLPYPKVGTTNSASRIGVIPAAGGETVWFEPADDLRNNYIPKMDWASKSDEIFFVSLNRLQNTAEFVLGDIATGEMRTFFTDSDEAWVNMRKDPFWLDDGSYMAWQSERDGWRHLYLVSRSGKEVRLVTPGDYDVVEIEQIDPEGGWVYFLASPDDPTTRYLYRSRLSGKGEAERLTPAGMKGSHSYQISEDAEWAIHSFSSLDQVPRTSLVSLPDHRVQRVLEDNAEAQTALEAVEKAPVETFRVDIGGGVLIDGWMMRPPDFDPTQTYPLLIYVYGEPANQTVQNEWGRSTELWHLMLAQKGYVVASLDNHGTPAPRGREWRKSIYRQIGILASADQAAGVRAILDRWLFLDSDRVGTWGWSGGGSMTLNALFRYPELYRTGIAVAPISDQKLYDTVYQERYMALPEINEDGFRDGSPITFAEQLEGDLLLIHGTGDDNVHYQSFERLVNKLIEYGKQFDMMSYPNRTHGIHEGEGTTMHLYSLMTNYLLEHLEPGPLPVETPEPSTPLGSG